MNGAEVQSVAAQAVSRLRELYLEVSVSRGLSFNPFGGIGEAVDTGLELDRKTIDLLEGELLERVVNPGGFPEGPTGELAWENWRNLADSTGQHLALLAGAVDKWDLSSTLAQVAIDTGQNLAAVARGIGSGLPWVAIIIVGLVALRFTKGRA